MNDYPFSKTWNKKTIFLWSLASMILLGSWILPASKAVWDAFDRICFYALNATIAWGKPFATFWAITGDRLFDYAAAAIILFLFIHFILKGGETSFRRGIALGFVTAVILLVVIGLQRELISYPRLSPTHALGDGYSIQTFVPWSRAKEASPSSFPGDHATVMMIMTILWWKAFGPKLGYQLLILAVIFTLPRMAAGAHWMSDAFIGGGFVVLLMLAVVDGTPLLWHLYKFSRPWSDKTISFVLEKKNTLPAFQSLGNLQWMKARVNNFLAFIKSIL